MTTSDLAKVVFSLPEDAPTSTESLWAKPLGDGLFELDNTPWYVRGFALGDIVRCVQVDGELPTVIELAEPSGNLTVRLFVPAGPEREMRKERIMNALRERGYIFEGMGENKGLIAVTIPRDIDTTEALKYLDELEAEKKAYWESGNF
jgi:hypothetical protein